MLLNKGESYSDLIIKSEEPYVFTSLLEKFNYRYENKYYKNNTKTLDYDVLSYEEKKEFFFNLAEKKGVFSLTTEFINYLQDNWELQAKLLIDVAKIETDELTYYTNNLLSHIHFFNKYQGDKDDTFSHEAVVSFIENGLDVNFNEEGVPLIHYIAMDLNLKTVKYLMKKGAKIDIIDESGDSILNCAMNNFETFAYLFKQDSIPKLKGNHLLNQAIFSQNEKVINLIANSNLMDDTDFVKKSQFQFPDEVQSLLINREKNNLEKQINEPRIKNKIKI